MISTQTLSKYDVPTSTSVIGGGCVPSQRDVSTGPVPAMVVIDGLGATGSMTLSPHLIFSPSQALSPFSYSQGAPLDFAAARDTAASAEVLFVRLAALSRPAAYRVLSRLSDVGAVRLGELEEELRGAQDWIAVAQLMRAGYVTEGRRRLHITSAGRIALQELRDRNPALPR